MNPIDKLYAWKFRRDVARWEATRVRDAEGVLAGAAAYSVGAGDTALLLIHGFADSPAIWQAMAPAFARRGYFCRAMRLPGACERFDAYAEKSSREAWIGAVVSESDALRKNHKRVVAVAHSLGATIALNTILEHPQCFDAAVLLAPLIEVSAKRVPFGSAEAWFRFAMRHIKHTPGMVSPFKAPRTPAISGATPRNRFIPLSVYTAMFASIEFLRGREADISLPLYMMTVARDKIVDSATAARFAERCAARKKLVEEFSNTGHAMPGALVYEDFCERIDAFLQMPQSTEKAHI